MIPEIARLPDISFIDDITLDDIKAKMITDYQDKFKEITGQAVALKEGEPITLMLYACAVQLFQMYLNVDKAGKMNFLKYAYGDFLDNLGALKGIERQTAAAAKCTVRFRLSAIRATVVAVPQGTRVTTEDATVYFATDEYAEIPIGSEYVDVTCTALEKGTKGNGYDTGSINVLVDPIPYLGTVSNTTVTSGGTEEETDESLADRTYLAPTSYSVAGPEAAYIFHTRSAYPDVEDVKVTSPNECEVDIRVVGSNGTILSEDVMQGIEDYLNSSNVKPMTDIVTVNAPTIQTFNVNFTYYINRTEASAVATIQEAVDKAVADYINWQSSKIGRDIEPGKLTELVMAAGAKRVVITAPAFVAVSATDVPKLGTRTVIYGGLQDD